MPGFVPSYGEGTMGELVLQVLRDAGDGGLTVTELIEACDRAGRKFKNAMAAQSGARNALVGQGNPKSQADAKAVFMCLSKEGKFVDQRWTLRFDNLDLTSLPQTPTGETVIVPKRGGKPGGRRKSSEPTEPRATRGAAAAVPAPEPPAETTTTTSARPQRQKSGGNKQLAPTRRIVRLKAVAGDLFDEKLIVRFVGVESVHHIIAIPPGIGVRGIFVQPIAVRVPHHIQPMPCPPLAILRRGYQRVDLRLGVGQFRARLRW